MNVLGIRLRLFGSLIMIASVLTPASAANSKSSSLFAMENLLAWCIVPYDSQHRTPAERVQMLQRLGFVQYVWDWRDQHLKDLPQEIAAAKAGGVRLRALWLWIDDKTDAVGALSSANRTVLGAVADSGLAVEFWVGIHPNVFEPLDEPARIRKGAALLSYLREEAAKSGSTVALYNHGDWIGEPQNQLRLIEAVGDPSIGMVYNFHHGHTQIADLPKILPRMVPHLRAVNLNGMVPSGPKIMTIGEGTHEKDMIRWFLDAGYRGPFGILGHTENEDVEKVLARNLAGLRAVTAGW
jgi:hypothetical protein